MLTLLFIAIIFESAFAGQASSVDEAKKYIRYRDYDRAIDELHLLLEQHNPEAELMMGNLYRSGKGVKKNAKKAYAHYKKAADAGLEQAQYALASLLEKKAKTQKEIDAYTLWYEKSALQGYAPAKRKLKKIKQRLVTKQWGKDDIYIAIRNKNADKIALLIRQKVSFNVLNEQLKSPLQVALLAKHSDLAKMIVPVSNMQQKVVDIDQIPLLLSVANDDEETTQLIVKHGADINAVNSFGNNALFVATRRGNTAMVKFLLAHQANPLLLNENKNNALMLAKILANKEVLNIYASHGFDVKTKQSIAKKLDLNSLQQQINDKNSIYSHWPLINVASLLGEEEIVAQLLAIKVTANLRDKDGFSALHRAASQGHEVVVKQLLEKGYPINAINKQGETALLLATKSGAIKVVKLLLANKARTDLLDKQGVSPLVAAIKNKDKKITSLLVKKTQHSAVIHQALLLAIQMKMTSISIKLYDKDEHKNKLDDLERSVLWHSVDNNLQQLTQHMLNDKVINIDVKDRNGYSALAQAVKKSRVKAVSLLVQNQANIYQKTQDGNNLLMLAVLEKNTALVDLFIQYKSLLNEQNNSGNTALMLAVHSGNLQHVTVLLKAGVNTLLRNDQNDNAYIMAQNLGYENMAKIIKKQGSQFFDIFK